MTTGNSVQKAPDYALHREGCDAPDVVANLKRGDGINMSHYHTALVQVFPSALCNPNVAVYFWSEAADAFIEDHTGISYAGKGAGIAYEFSVDARGRIMVVVVTACAAGTVSVAVSGFEIEHPE